MEPIYEEEYKGFKIEIHQDDDPMNPVEDYDMLGKQVYWHRRMNLGHCWKETERNSPEEWLECHIEGHYDTYEHWEKCYSRKMGYFPWLVQEFEKENLVIPVHAYERGGITISASGRRAGWDSFDSGQLGFVYVSHEDIKKEYKVSRLTKKVLERAEKCLIAEVEEYDHYLCGEVYGFRIIDTVSEDELDSCWGFIGDYKYALEEAKSRANFLGKHRDEEEKKLDERMVS